MDDARDNLLTVLAYARHYSEGSRLEKEIKDEIKAIEVNEFDTNGIPYGAKFQSSFALLNLGKNLFQQMIWWGMTGNYYLRYSFISANVTWRKQKIIIRYN